MITVVYGVIMPKPIRIIAEEYVLQKGKTVKKRTITTYDPETGKVVGVEIYINPID